MLKYRFTSLAILALALSFSLTTSAAETKSSKSPGKPQAKKPRPKPVVSPLLFGDGRLTFQVSAPNAKEVFLTGEMLKTKRILLGKDGRGIWSATIAPVAPGVYEYSFLIDGQKTIDPGNSQIKPMRSPRSSILHIRGNESERHHADFRNDIPHGTVHYHSYHSLAIGLTEMDEFGWVGAFSAACPDAEAVASALKDSANTNVRLKLLWIAIGKKDFLLKENRRFRDELKEAGVKHVYRETEGSHSWPVWRGYLAEFAPLLFQ